MKEILSVENMRRSDANTIETKTPSLELMYRAGKAVADSVEWRAPVGIVCGYGNNAGDGYVIALELKKRGVDCALVLLGDRFSADGKYYFDKCVANKIPARVAPKVFAIVFSERIAELVRSICLTNKSKSSPLLFETFLSCSISEGFVLKTIASKSSSYNSSSIFLKIEKALLMLCETVCFVFSRPFLNLSKKNIFLLLYNVIYS